MVSVLFYAEAPAVLINVAALAEDIRWMQQLVNA